MSALLLSNGFEQLRLQSPVPAAWSAPVQSFSKKTSTATTAEQILSDAGLRMRLATEKDQDDILQFLRSYFFHDEPLNKAIKLLSSGYGSKCEDLEKFSLSCIKEDISIICESKDGSHEGMAAVLLLGVAKREEEETLAEDIKPLIPVKPLSPTASPDERFDKIERLLDLTVATADLFGLYPDVDEMLDIKIISIHPTFRGRKVAIAMMDKARDLAAERGIEVIRSICSSHFTAMALARLGYECICRLPYNEFLDTEGNIIFDPEPPHAAVTMYAIRLKDKSS